MPPSPKVAPRTPGTIRPVRLVLVSVLVAAAACGRPAPADAPAGGTTSAGTGAAPATPPAAHRLAAPGRDAATPAIAAMGSRVVVTWGSTAAGGRIDIMAAVSEDGGVTFGAPVTVNDAVADVRVGGEQPPRVAFASADVVVVVWPARRGTASEIRAARSTDGGRTFGASFPVHPSGLPGLRGWASVSGDGQGRAYVAWLDGRNADPAAGSAHAHADAAPTASSTAHEHAAGPAAAPATRTSPRQDLFRAVIEADGAVREQAVATDVCFCCKTAIVATPSGVDMAWRHIFPQSMRDIGFAHLGAALPSAGTPGAAPAHDHGGAPAAAPAGDVVRVSADHWQIDACPDDGPAMVVDASGARHVVWPTMVQGDKPEKAVFYATSGDGRTFSARTRLSEAADGVASHPQIALAPDGTLATAWDERSGGTVRVRLRLHPAGAADWQAADVMQDSTAADDRVPAYYPALASTSDAWVIAWTSASEPDSAIVVRRLPRR
ncbi:MAG: sialidase family protein [Vicinamibacterales bacterium]